LYFVQFGCLTSSVAYRDKKVVGVFVPARFRAPQWLWLPGLRVFTNDRVTVETI
jgi:hypothetical protein